MRSKDVEAQRYPQEWNYLFELIICYIDYLSSFLGLTPIQKRSIHKKYLNIGTIRIYH